MSTKLENAKSQNNATKVPRSHWRRINKNIYRYRHWLFIGQAYTIAEKHDFAGLPKVNKRQDPWQPFKFKGNPKSGDLFLASETEVEPLRMALKAAHDDIKNDRYTDRVIDVIDKFEKLRAKDYLYKGVKRRIDKIGVEDL